MSIGIDIFSKQLTMPADESKSIASHEYTESLSRSKARERIRGGRTRGWTPLKYPRSAIFSDENESTITPFFPYHPDILRAVVRELLILEGKIDHRTLKVTTAIHTEAQYQSQLNAPLSEGNTSNMICSSKRPCSPFEDSTMRKRFRMPSTTAFNRETGSDIVGEDDVGPASSLMSRSMSAEQLVSTILNSLLLAPQSISTVSTDVSPTGETPTTSIAVAKRPRKISEVDQMTEKPPKIHSVLPSPDNISHYLNLSEHDESGAFLLLGDNDNTVPQMLHVSISDEARLRDAAMEMTKRLVGRFDNKALGLFFGYKFPSTNHSRIAQLFSSFLFDTSHAMFAWIQTEQEFLAHHRQTENLDMDIQESLFDQRAVHKIGGLKPHCILPQAISIRRLRQRNITWEKFATTAQSKRMFGLYGKEKSLVTAGKERRGQRLRQQQWRTSNSITHDNDESHTISTARSRSSSLASELDLIDEPVDREATLASCLARQTRILSDVAGSKMISLIKSNTLQSWGVGLVQEGCACIVGKARSDVEGSVEAGAHLRCGDMILFVHNDRGEYAAPPICSWSESHTADEEWFRKLVNIFKKSAVLHLVVQRA